MAKEQYQDNPDVFEMILKSSGGLTSSVLATPSKKIVNEDWQEEHQEGQLTVDVIDADKELIVVSTMAGADASKVEVYIHNDLLTIRGIRVIPVEDKENTSYLHQECYWGKFSRTIVLPVDVKGYNAKAEYKNGVLIIKIPKLKTDSKIEVKIIDE